MPWDIVVNVRAATQPHIKLPLGALSQHAKKQLQC